MKQNELDAAYWSNRYQEGQTGWDVGFCSTPLQVYFDQLKDKSISILIPGAGYGHEAIYLHSQGFNNVFVVDLAFEPFDFILSSCPDFSKNNLICCDFFEHLGQYDLIVEQTFFCALEPCLRNNYVAHMRGLLKPKGKLVGVLFNRSFEGGPPFGGSIDEYEHLFTSVFKSVSIERCYNSIPPRMDGEVFIRIS